MIAKSKCKFWVDPMGRRWGMDVPFIMSVEGGNGYLIYSDGTYKVDVEYTHRTCASRDVTFTEIPYDRAISLLDDFAKEKLSELVEIEYGKDIQLNKDNYDKILGILKNNRAFNADSACKIESDYSSLCRKLSRLGVLGGYESKFFIVDEKIHVQFEDDSKVEKEIPKKKKKNKEKSDIQSVWRMEKNIANDYIMKATRDFDFDFDGFDFPPDKF